MSHSGHLFCETCRESIAAWKLSEGLASFGPYDPAVPWFVLAHEGHPVRVLHEDDVPDDDAVWTCDNVEEMLRRHDLGHLVSSALVSVKKREAFLLVTTRGATT